MSAFSVMEEPVLLGEVTEHEEPAEQAPVEETPVPPTVVVSNPYKYIVGEGQNRKYVQGGLQRTKTLNNVLLLKNVKALVDWLLLALVVQSPATCRLCAERKALYMGNLGIMELAGFEFFESLEILWLNSNKLSCIENLDSNFRMKELYVQAGSSIHFVYPSLA